MPTSAMNIGIWRIPGIGDNLLLAPSLRAIRRVLPDAWIHLWGHPEAAELLMRLGLVDSCGDTAKGLRMPARPLDAFIAFDWQHEALRVGALGHGLKTVATANCIGVRGQWHPEHFYITVTRTLDIDYNPCDWRVGGFRDLPVERDHAGSVVLFCGASEASKRWEMGRYSELGERLSSAGYQVRYLESPRDNYGEPDGGPVLTRSLEGMASIFQNARLCIGNDTGPTHLAALMGCPVLALFGPTPPCVWRPLGDQTVVIQRCVRREGRDPSYWCKGHRDCMTQITVDDVQSTALAILEQQEAMIPRSVA